MARKLNVKTATERKRLPPPDPVEFEEDERPGSNIPDRTVEKFTTEALRLWQAAQKLKDQYDSANGAYRAKLKDAKGAGIDPAAITRYIRNRDKDPVDLDREEREYYRVCRLMGLPVGTQLDIFGEGGSPARAVDEERIASNPNSKITPAQLKAKAKELADLERRKAAAAEKGRTAGRAGKPMKSGYPQASVEHLAYVYAYDEGQAENLNSLGKGDVKDAPLQENVRGE